jgi:coronin-1B/1C/6
MCFLPRRALNVSECEIARAYKVIASASSSWIEPIAFVVPRKADSFQADIFPPAPSTEPSLTAGEFFSGREEITRKVVDLSSGVTSAAIALPPTITPSPNPPPHLTLASLSPTTASGSSGPIKAAPLGAATLSTSFKPAANAQEYTAREYGSLGTSDMDVSTLSWFPVPIHRLRLISVSRLPH